MSALYFETPKGGQTKFEVITEDQELVDKALDQINLIKDYMIDESQFKTDIDLMSIEVIDDETDELVGILTTKKL